MPDNRPSLGDIARALGVSTMTVSRALRGRSGVSAELRDRIHRQASALGYHPDPTLQRLTQHLRSRRQSGIRAVVAAVTDIPTRIEPAYCTRLRTHAAGRARELGFAFSVLRVSPKSGGWSAALRALHARGVEGVLLLPLVAPTTLEAAPWSAFSVIAATSSVVAPAFHRVIPHHALNARLLIARLSALGHRRIGFIGTHTHSLRSLDAFPSAIAWHHARLGLRCTPLLHPPATQPDIVDWARRERPDVIVLGRESDLPAYQTQLASAGLSPAWALAAVDPENQTLFGMDERHDLLGAAAIDTLAGMIARTERGVPAVPAMTLLPGDWHDAGRPSSHPDKLQ